MAFVGLANGADISPAEPDNATVLVRADGVAIVVTLKVSDTPPMVRVAFFVVA